ncbi:mediator complex, subunit Med4 [Podospora didyma]|uniref:Mediator of RNA polymerase II transcription subunit 4 n=1 Tax=Podospora didyma TaxID=330526 RepID=A0AAE0NYZ6_9PEZI|nr:mediator complex, subunit Med4 [Podospora didyma]
MDKNLDARFERVEKALANLIDSIAKYNPSEKLAEGLVEADKELFKGLQALETHQNNYARIQQLREETAALDAQTKEIIGALWTMRKEVKNTQTTVYPASGPKYQFTTKELLDYARRISPNTLPPPGVTNGVDFGTPTPTPAEQPDDAAKGGGAQTPNTSFNGTGTAAGTPAASGAPPTPSVNGDMSSTHAQPPGFVSQTSLTSSILSDLPPLFKQAIIIDEGAVFVPWPDEFYIRSGALASYQALVDRNIDPKGYDPEEEEQRRKEEEAARKEAEEKARIEREEAERRMREERERMARERERNRAEAERRGSVATGFVPPPKTQFTFLDAGDDDDDD